MKHRCKAITRKGTPCKNYTLHDNDYCYSHSVIEFKNMPNNNNISSHNHSEKYVLSKFNESLTAWRKLLLNLIFITSLFLIIVMLLVEFTRRDLILEHFHVPQRLANDGYSGQVLASMLEIQMKKIREGVDSNKINEFLESGGLEKNNLPKVWKDIPEPRMPNVQIPGTEIYISPIIIYLKSLFGLHPTNIRNICVLRDSVLVLTTSIGYKAATVKGSIIKLDSLISILAEHIYSETEPLTLAMYFFSNGDNENTLKAINSIQEDLSVTKKNWGYLLEGFVYEKMKKYDYAIKSYNKAIEIDSLSGDAYFRKRQIYTYYLNRRDLALKELSKLIEIYPKTSFYRELRGETYEELGKYDKALTDFSFAIQLSESSFSFYRRAEFFARRCELNLALQDFSKAIDIDPTRSYYYYSRAEIYTKFKMNSMAQLDYNKAISLDSSNAFAYQHRGDFYSNLGLLDLAAKDFSKCIELAPMKEYYYVNRSEIYLIQKKYDLALSDLNHATKLNSEDSYLYFFRGKIYDQMKMPDSSLREYTKGIEVSPGTDTYLSRGDFYLNRRMWKKAIRDYNKAISFVTDYGYPFIERGDLYKTIGKMNLAQIDFKKAIEIETNKIRKFPDVQAYITRATAYAKIGEFDSAILDLSELIKISPCSGFNHYRVGRVYAIMKNTKFAIDYLVKAYDLGYNCLRRIDIDTEWNNIRDEKEFQFALKRLLTTRAQQQLKLE